MIIKLILNWQILIINRVVCQEKKTILVYSISAQPKPDRSGKISAGFNKQYK
jgi:hypothetical protein